MVRLERFHNIIIYNCTQDLVIKHEPLLLLRLGISDSMKLDSLVWPRTVGCLIFARHKLEIDVFAFFQEVVDSLILA